MKVGMITTWKTPCGVAKYAEELCYDLSKLVDLTVYAEEILPQSREDPPIKPEFPIKYTRDWQRGKSYDQLYSDVVLDKPDILHIQYESAMYNEGMFAEGDLYTFLRRIHNAGIKTVLTLHNVPAFSPVAYYSDWYKKIESHFIVTNELMQKELLKWQPNVSSSIIPLGSTIFEPKNKVEARRLLGLPEDGFYIIQTGFYGYDKGMLPLIEAMPEILKTIPDAKLILAGSIHPLSPIVHKEYLRSCLKKAFELGLQKSVIFTNKFLPESELSLYLSSADIVAINHQYVFGLVSSSASSHRALCCGRPILMNDTDVRLSEYKSGETCFKCNNHEISSAVLRLKNDEKLQKTITEGALKYAQETSFENIAKKHFEVYKKC